MALCEGGDLSTVIEKRKRRSVYLLYWYKSTNTDAEGPAAMYSHGLCEGGDLSTVIEKRKKR